MLAALAARAQGRADRDRQRHGVARDRPARRRSHRSAIRSSSSTKTTVSEAGASVYSASAYAAQELPGLDVTLRGAASIARRLQDPLAELVKIDPKSIGVGQYQHDLSEQKLGRSLDAVVEDCVNAVGVDVNTASAKLLARVSGVGEALAQAIVVHRETHGAFRNRAALKEVPRLGAQSLRAQRRLPAHQPWRPAARPLGRPSGGLSGGAPHPREAATPTFLPSSAMRKRSSGPEARRFRRPEVRRADGRRHLQGAGEARPRSPPGVQDGGVQGGGRLDRRPEARHGPRRRRHQRRGLRRLRRRRRPSGRARPCFGDGEHVS